MKKLTMGLAIVLSVVMLLSVGVFANETESAVEFLLPVGKPEVTVAGMTDADADIVVNEIYADDFFESGMESEVIVYFDVEMYDAKDKLKLSIVDDAGKTVATQVGCSFNYQEWNMHSLVYKLQTVSGTTLSDENEYQVKFSYSGSYTFGCIAEYLDIYPMTKAAIIRIDSLDVANSVFFVRAANIDKNETYYMTLNDGDPVKVNVADGGFVVDFDEYNPTVTEYNGMYCNFVMYTEGADGNRENLSYYDQEYYGDSCGAYMDENYNGVGFPEKIGASSKSFYVYTDGKTDGGEYTTSDSGIATLYTANGEVVGTAALTPYYNDYDGGYYSLDGEMTVTKALDADCKYYLVADDGYSIRIDTVFTTSEPICGYVGVQYDEDSYSHIMPTAETVEGRIHDAYNMPDLSKISVKIAEWDSKAVVYDLVPGSVKLGYETSVSFSLSRKAEVSTEKQYLMYVYYNGREVESVEMSWDGGSDVGEIYINTMGGIQTESATYIVAHNNLNGFNPKSVTFKLENTNDTVKNVKYHRELWSSGNYSYYVLKIDESIELSDSGWTLTVNDASGVIASDNYLYSGYEVEPFLYEQVMDLEGYVNIYGEGLSDSASYAICFIDKNTGNEVSIPVTKVRGEGILRVACDVTSKYYLDDESAIFLTVDGQPVKTIEMWYFLVGAKDKSTSFYFTYDRQNHKVAILNLPSSTYTQYKLADSEAGLASASYKAITNSIVYVLPSDDGEQTVYAQFKDASGKESDVRMATVNVDASKPVISDLTNVPEKILATEDYWGDLQVRISFTVTAGEEGELTYYFVDENGKRVSNWFSIDVTEGVNNINRTVYIRDEELLTAKKLVVYMTDAARNKSDELSAPCPIVEKHSKYTVGKTTYCVNNETGAIDNVDSEDKEVIVPSTLGGKPVTFINSNAFAEEYTIKKIVLPETVTTIGMGAFSYMYLEEINIPSKVTILSDSLFMETISLKKLMLPAGLKTIEYGAFDGFTSCPAIYFDGTKAQWENVSIASGGNSIIYGDYATIYFADGSADIENVYDEGHGNDGMLVIEATLGADTGKKTIIVNGSELYYSVQRNVYVGLVSEGKISDDSLDGVIILDKEPSNFIYGNADGDYDIESYDEAVDSADLQSLKLSLKGTKKLAGMNLIASDVDGDGICDSSDLQSLKLNVKSGRILPVLK